MTEAEWNDKFKIDTPDKYYGESDDSALVKGTIRDESSCQLLYFTLDGMDVLGKIALQSLPLFTDQTHVIVVKAGGMGTAKFRKRKDWRALCSTASRWFCKMFNTLSPMQEAKQSHWN